MTGSSGTATGQERVEPTAYDGHGHRHLGPALAVISAAEVEELATDNPAPVGG